tara:strand:- start:218 stop:379 length:162 start_codon:yes stop_codon:yes gene_type:complete
MARNDSQKSRFEQAARELGVDLDEDKLKEALRRMRDAPPVAGDKDEKKEKPGR